MLTREMVYEQLDKHPGSTVHELAAKLGFSSSYVKALLGDLRQDGEVYYERIQKTNRGCCVRWYP